MIILALIATLAILGVCFALAHRKILASADNGARAGIVNDDVSVDNAYDKYLVLTNLEDPCNF